MSALYYWKQIQADHLLPKYEVKEGTNMVKSKNIVMRFSHFDRDLREIFHDFFSRENPMLMMEARHWAPNADIYETNKGLMVKVELSGLNSEHIDIEFKGNLLVIQGKRVEHSTADKVRCLQLEINYGDFYRCVTLPPNMDFDKANAKMKDGFLLIFVPFKPSRKVTVEER
jgi:HSP20 family protein